MKTLNRIKLTQEFQDLQTLITDFDDKDTYGLQFQGQAQMEIVESATEPTLETTGALPNTAGRRLVSPLEVLTYKGDATNKLWVRATFFGENYVSAWLIEEGE